MRQIGILTFVSWTSMWLIFLDALYESEKITRVQIFLPVRLGFLIVIFKSISLQTFYLILVSEKLLFYSCVYNKQDSKILKNLIR